MNSSCCCSRSTNGDRDETERQSTPFKIKWRKKIYGTTLGPSSIACCCYAAVCCCQGRANPYSSVCSTTVAISRKNSARIYQLRPTHEKSMPTEKMVVKLLCTAREYNEIATVLAERYAAAVPAAAPSCAGCNKSSTMSCVIT